MGGLIELLDNIARLIGWLAIIGLVFWVLGQIAKDKRTERERLADLKEEREFEEALRMHSPLKYNRYREERQWRAVNGERLKWYEAAEKVGIKRSDLGPPPA
ncbi:hypothetical protein [Novosphingobium sp. CECT 9465]|uniref:hypothetical protein n=1 Tax=Novosphingobium sp. CECT 9465 TaxID=2829794 RepID=UPI001E2EADA6|nr:hypothetical protein [Novosphingobium sp. CECT 9465]CAH0497404.1 hypothetical protein NVSP9465_02464 [Novosphingobium sp. CECT 9465]